MEPGPPIHEVEFEQRRLRPGGQPPELVHFEANAKALGDAMARRGKVARAVVVVLGAAGIAWATQRAGIALPQALCFFFGALPVLWVGGWLAGVLLQMRVMVRRTTKAAQAIDWQAELAERTVLERVKLALTEAGLTLTRPDGTSSWAWHQVELSRPSPEAMLLHLGTRAQGMAVEELLEVPASAFADSAAFDAFCLEVQRRVWEAQRAFTSRRA